MYRTSFKLGLFALLLSFGLMACGDDGPTQSGDTLTEAEVESMMSALVEAGGFGAFGFGFSPVDGDMAMQQATIDETVPCSEDGSVRIQGSFSVNQSGENFTWNLTQTHNDCSQSASTDGSIWTFNGNPSVSMNFTGSASESSFNFQGNQQGGISWSNGSRSGSCQINVSYNMTSSQTSATVNVSGTVCGVDVSQSETVSL